AVRRSIATGGLRGRPPRDPKAAGPMPLMRNSTVLTVPRGTTPTRTDVWRTTGSRPADYAAAYWPISTVTATPNPQLPAAAGPGNRAPGSNALVVSLNTTIAWNCDPMS